MFSDSERELSTWIYAHRVELIDAVVIGWRPRQLGGVSLFLADPPTYMGRCVAPESVLEPLGPLAAPGPPLWMPVRPLGVHWVRPELHVEVTAASRTPDGRLREPEFRRVRS